MDDEARDSPVPDINMMPMIDVIFLLVIFFMLVSDVASIESNVNLELPPAKMAKANLEAPPGRIVVNVLKDGSMQVMGKPCDFDKLRLMLMTESQLSRHLHDGRNRVSLLLRADTNAPSAMLRKIFLLCMHPDVGISEIAIEAAVQED